MTVPTATAESTALTALPSMTVPRLPGKVRISRLDSGLTLCHLENRLAPVVTCALTYRVGCRDEEVGQGGIQR